MMEKTTAYTLVEAISEGRACLLLGQDHTEGLVESVIRETSTLASTKVKSLADVLSAVDEATVIASMNEHVATRHVSLVELASLPWSSVVSTAIDRNFLDALNAAGTVRRLVEVAAERIALTTGAHSPATLHLFPVLGRTGASGDLTTPNSQTLKGKLLLKLPRAFDALPQLLGPRGVLVIEGMAANAWLDDHSWAVISQVLRTIPAGRTYWFGWAPNSLRLELAELVEFVDARLTSMLAIWVADKTISSHLAVGRTAVFGVDDHVYTVGVGGNRKTVRFSAKDWRELRRVGSTIDDAEVDELCISASEQQTGGLAGFVGRAHIGIPDWAGAAHGYCFRRDATDRMVNTVVHLLSSAKQSVHDPSGGGQLRRPLLLSGPPAIGKSVGLLHVAWELRKTHRIFVLWLLPGLSGINTVQIERVIRMAESRGVSWTVLVVDGALPEECERILNKLLSDGRNVVLIGTETTQIDRNVQAPKFTRFPISIPLSPAETSQWSVFLAKHGLEDLDNGGGDFLTRLNRVVPETGYGSTGALLQEYERVIRASQPSSTDTRYNEGPLAQKLRELFPELMTDNSSGKPTCRFEGDPFVRDLVQIILFCASADLPVATDTLFVLLGSDLLNSFQRIQNAFEKTALIQEVAMDNEGTTALTTAHRLHAQWLLRAICPTVINRLEILRSLVERVPWNLDAYPGDNPTQDYIIRVLRQVGPRGAAAPDFDSLQALKTLADILSSIWRSQGKRHPGLLSLEAMIRGDIAQRDTGASSKEKRQQCSSALELLDSAIEILRARHPSEARNFEMQRVLSLASDIRGSNIHSILEENNPSLTEMQNVLNKLQSDAMMARSYDTQYHPLDIVFWANRDARKLLERASLDEPEVQAGFLAAMQMALDVAQEEQIVDKEQKRRFDGRCVEFNAILGKVPLAREQAEKMRSQGNFAGELVLSRIRVEGAQRHKLTCREEFERFLSFGPAVLLDVRVLRYLCSLWLNAWAGPTFGTGQAILCAAPASAWEQLQQIARARLAVPEDSEHPLTTFLFGWSQIQLGDATGAKATLTQLERRSIGMRRRIGELAIISNEDGRARPFVAQVRGRKGDRVVSWIEALGIVLEIRPDVETEIMPSGMKIDEMVRVSLAMNYRGLQVRALEMDGKR